MLSDFPENFRGSLLLSFHRHIAAAAAIPVLYQIITASNVPVFSVLVSLNDRSAGEPPVPIRFLFNTYCCPYRCGK